MKNVIATMILIAVASMACDKDESFKNGTLSISKITYSGCFTAQKGSVENIIGPWSDSLYFKIDNSTLHLHIDKIYSHCGVLKDSVKIKDNIVNIYIFDTNPLSLACSSVCLFKYDYSLVNFSQKNIHFKVYLKEFEDYNLWKETHF